MTMTNEKFWVELKSDWFDGFYHQDDYRVFGPFETREAAQACIKEQARGNVNWLESEFKILTHDPNPRNY